MANEATERVRNDWDSQADKWFEERESLFEASRPIHDWLVAHLDPRDGQRIIEIAAGPGDTGFLIAPMLGAGRLLSTDLSPQMLANARRRASELGITNVDFKLLDAQAMDLPDASFDGAVCRWGFMLMPDPAAALRETKRILVPGGRLAFAVFTAPEKNPFASVPAKILIEMGHMSPPSAGWKPGILALADRARLESLVHDAGFRDLAVESVAMTWMFADTDDYWRFLIDLTALGPLVRSLSDEGRNRFRQTLDDRLRAFEQNGRIELPSECWCSVAVA
jgi:ubiquinone/menaquinone biosynthesis C-methylase UbiE